MEPELLKHAVTRVHLPPQARARILRACREQAAANGEETAMKNRTQTFAHKKPFAALAVAALCVCFAAGAVAAGRAGAFVDVTDWLGAVTGGRYEQAGQEVGIEAAYADGTLTVTAELLLPQEIPYRELDTLCIEHYRIADSAGRTVAEGGPTAAAAIQNGSARLSVACGALDGGEYTLYVESFTGGAKADAPLPIVGGWQCAFRA